MPERTIRYLRFKLAAIALAEKWNNHQFWDNFMDMTASDREISRIDLNDLTRAFWMIEKLSRMTCDVPRRPTILSRIDLKNMAPKTEYRGLR